MRIEAEKNEEEKSSEKSTFHVDLEESWKQL